MKRNIIKTGLFMFAMGALTVSCTGDLDVTPIDPNLDTPENVLTGTEAYNQLLAKCYIGLAVSSPDGSGGDPDIKGIDGGFGQYLRALFNMQELPTDEAVVGWNDQTLKDLHGLQWTAADVFVSACYSRLFYQISICNEVMRRIGNTDDATLKQYRAEARALRGLSYLHAIDLFGNVPFTDENSEVGGAKAFDVRTSVRSGNKVVSIVSEVSVSASSRPSNSASSSIASAMASSTLVSAVAAASSIALSIPLIILFSFASITIVLSSENATNPDFIRLDNYVVTSASRYNNLTGIL